MSPAILALITQIIQLAVAYVPDLIKEGQLAIGLLNKTEDLTPEEQAAIDAALDKAQAALQAKIAADTAPPQPPATEVTQGNG